MSDYILRAIDKEGTMRVFVASTSNIVEEARKIHNTTPTATAALGRTLTATSIMGIMMKGEKDTISVQFRGDGPIGTVLAVSNSRGEVKGYVGDPSVDLPLKDDGKLDVGGAVGKHGRLIVVKDLGLKEPYVGQSNLITGEIGEDLARYFAYSDQQPSAVALGVLVDRDMSVRAAGGYIVQVMPNISNEALEKLESRITSAEPISMLIDRGDTPEDILDYLFGDFEMEIKDKIEIQLKCDCSEDRIEKALISIGEKELKEIIEEEGKAELVCHFCNSKYHYDKEGLERLLKEASQ